MPSAEPFGWVPDPPADDPWIATPDSLTAAITARCERFRVARRFEGQRTVRPEDARIVGEPAGGLAWVRDVTLMADEEPVVVARTVLARTDLDGVWSFLSRLGTRPLGGVLYADAQAEREPFEYRYIHRFDLMFGRFGQLEPGVGGDGLWARRSVFRREGRPLLLIEAFLPAIYDLRRGSVADASRSACG